MSKHHLLGPSAAERWVNCPGSVEMTRWLPDTPSEFAAEGSVAHTLSEWARLEGRACEEFVGRVVEHDGYTFTIDYEMAEHVQKFVDYCAELPGEALIEERVSLHPYVPDGFGRADDIRICTVSKQLHVTDLKYGKGIKVEATDNMQAMLYGLGAYLTFGPWYEMDEDWEVINTIHQPRLGPPSVAEPIKVKHLLAWAEEVIRPAAVEALKRKAVIRAGKWCKFCKFKPKCTVNARFILEENLKQFDVLTPVAEEDDFDPEAAELTAEDIGRIMDHMSDIKSWLSDIEAEAVRRVTSGEEIIGKKGPYKLVAGRASRRWSDEEAVKAKLLTILDEDKIFVKKMVSPAQAEKLLGRRKSEVMDFIKVEAGKPTLAPFDDNRPPFGTEEFALVGD